MQEDENNQIYAVLTWRWSALRKLMYGSGRNWFYTETAVYRTSAPRECFLSGTSE